MEVLNGVVSKSIPIKFDNTHVGKPWKLKTQLYFSKRNNGYVVKISNSKKLVVNCCGYENTGHLEYYGEIKGKRGKRVGWNFDEEKDKLLKNLVKDLSTFSDLGFGLNFDSGEINQGFVVDQDKSVVISQAAEVLLTPLKQLRVEEEKQKKKERQEKKQSKCKNGDCDSSSSSSESSDSECDEEVVDMKSLRNVSVIKPIDTKETHSSNDLQLPALEGSGNEQLSLKPDQDCCNMILETTLNKDVSIEVLSSITLNPKQPIVGKWVEVCMGGKWRKSGAPELIEAFQKAIGNETAVVGCKCMGKCKSGHNTKVLNGADSENLGDDSLRTPSNPLYIGVGLEDVELIVANYFGEEMKGLGLSTLGASWEKLAFGMRGLVYLYIIYVQSESREVLRQ